MTLHWWMHWFWITVFTVTSILFVAPLTHSAPQSSPSPYLSEEFVSSADIDEDIPEKTNFHDSSLYHAMSQAKVYPSSRPENLADDSQDDNLPPAGIFLPHIPGTSILLSEESEHLIPVPTIEVTDESHLSMLHHLHDEEHRGSPRSGAESFEKEHNSSLPQEESHDVIDVIAAEHDEQSELVFPRDISPSSRSGKAIGRDFTPSTAIPVTATSAAPQETNHNPYKNEDKSSEEMADAASRLLGTPLAPIEPSSKPGSTVKVEVVAVTEPPQINDEVEVTDMTHHPVQMSTDAPKIPLGSEPVFKLSTVQPVQRLPNQDTSVTLSPWNSYEPSEDQNSNEGSSEEEHRPAPGDSDDEEVEEAPVATDSEGSEAVTRRMTAERGGLDTPSIVGIVLGLTALVSLVGGVVGFVLYRRRFINKPQTFNDKCSNADSSGYIDDTLRVSATRMNGAAEAPRRPPRPPGGSKGRPQRKPQPPSTLPQHKQDNSEEMYSLDNDSFLNSLEAMTIQNYWTDSVKHTKL